MRPGAMRTRFGVQQRGMRRGVGTGLWWLARRAAPTHSDLQHQAITYVLRTLEFIMYRIYALGLSFLICITLLTSSNARAAQTVSAPAVKPMGLSGPRAGFLLFTGEEARQLKEKGFDPYTVMLGWQFELSWLSTQSGLAGLVEIVPMITGFDQGQFWPSANLVIGLRSAGGIEVGMGMQGGLTGVAALFAAGATIETGGINIPIHVAAVRSRDGVRVGLLVGFSLAREP